MNILDIKARRPHAASYPRGFRTAVLTAASAFALISTPALAFEIDTGNPEVKIHWDTQVKYTAAFRVESQSHKLTNPFAGAVGANSSGLSLDDGDRNFDKGLVSNRVDLFSEFDLSYHGWGFRASGAGWYDQVYNSRNDNDSVGALGIPGVSTVNKLGDNREFNQATQELHGQKAELLDAFIFGKFNAGDTRVSFRAGRHALQWGETLFFGGNGIAGGMAPIDIVKALSVPNVLFKELIRPVGQVSAQWQLSSDLSIGAYYQYEWERSVLPGVGSYFSSVDIFDEGGEFFLPPGFGTVVGQQSPRVDDDRARQQGQFGAQVRFRVPGWSPDFGIYGIHYHAKTFSQVNLALAAFPTSYQLVYGEDITAVGASISNTFGPVNIAAEGSIRFNQPLASSANLYVPGVVNVYDPTIPGVAANSDNKLWAVGRTFHANVSALWSVSPYFLAKESVFVAEVAYNRLQKVTENPGFLNPYTDKNGLAIFLNYEPVYRQVLPGLDISVPMGVTYAPIGNDAAGIFINQTGDDGGSANVGLSFTYLDVWRAGVQYTRFLGPTGVAIDAAGQQHYDQPLKDRDFVSINLRRTF